MKAASFLSLYDKLEKLVYRLPEALQTPILREISPIKTLFLLQRPPRLALIGERAASKAELINALFDGEVLRRDEESMHDGQWQALTRRGRGTLRLLDARRPVSLSAARGALAREPADLFVFVRSAREIDSELPQDLEHAARLIESTLHEDDARDRFVIGVQLGGDDVAREQLHAALHTEPRIEGRMLGTLACCAAADETARLVELLGNELPPEAQLELARLSGNRPLQKQIAQVVVKSVTAICAAVGAQPIPLADFPILTSLQASMVAGIMHISGREMSAKLAGEFIGALGANIGAGLVLREGARAAAKFVPLWGNAISGAVAAAGTYGVGRAAVAYFIEGMSMPDARSFFRKAKMPRLLKK